MKEIILLLGMLFCHIVDDYYLQGWLASAKQRAWWEKNSPNPLYKNDYLMALVEHAFSWTCMIHLPIIVLMVLSGVYANIYLFILLFAINWTVHIITDNAKANQLRINLIQDQIIHISQLVITWIIYILVM